MKDITPNPLATLSISQSLLSLSLQNLDPTLGCQGISWPEAPPTTALLCPPIPEDGQEVDTFVGDRLQQAGILSPCGWKRSNWCSGVFLL